MYGYDVFHEDMLKELIQSAREQRTQHAYIFEGDKGIGKTKAAHLFSASLVCENNSLAPCGSCPACIGAKADTNPDIIYVNSGEKKSLGVDIIRDVVTDAYIKPFESPKKVYIIEDGDMLTEQAQNAFLKMLEEPPLYTIFIILVSNASSLLQTILSRCTVLSFPQLPREEIKNYITTNYPDADCDFLASYAEGNPGRVDEIMNNDNFFVLRTNALKMLLPLLSSHKISAYKIADFFEENKDNAQEIIKLWQSMIRDIIFIQNSATASIINSDIKDELTYYSNRISPSICLLAGEKLQRAVYMQKKYVNLRAMALNLSLSIKKEVK